MHARTDPAHRKGDRKARIHEQTGRPPQPFGKQSGSLPRASGLGLLRALALGDRAPPGGEDDGGPGHRNRREIAAVFLKDTVDAATAHTVQKKDRRLPGAAEAVPGGVRPVVVGDRPPHRDLSPRGETEGVQPHFRHQMALLGLADDLGLGCIFTE